MKDRKSNAISQKIMVEQCFETTVAMRGATEGNIDSEASGLRGRKEIEVHRLGNNANNVVGFFARNLTRTLEWTK